MRTAVEQCTETAFNKAKNKIGQRPRTTKPNKKQVVGGQSICAWETSSSYVYFVYTYHIIPPMNGWLHCRQSHRLRWISPSSCHVFVESAFFVIYTSPTEISTSERLISSCIGRLVCLRIKHSRGRPHVNGCAAHRRPAGESHAASLWCEIGMIDIHHSICQS